MLSTKDQTYITKIQIFIDKNENLSHIKFKEIIESKNNTKDNIYKFHCNKCNEDFECTGNILLGEAFLKNDLCHPMSTKDQTYITKIQIFIDKNENLSYIKAKEVVEFKHSFKAAIYKFHCNKCNEDFECSGFVLLNEAFLQDGLCHPLYTKEQLRINKIQLLIDKNKNLSHIKAKEVVEYKNNLKSNIYKFHCNKCNEDFICSGDILLSEFFLKNDLCHPLVPKDQTYINKIQIFIDKNKNLSHIKAKEIVKIENQFKTTIYKFHCNKCNEDFICSGTVIIAQCFLKNGLCHPLPTKEQIYINKIQIFIDKNKNLSHIELKEIIEFKDSIKATIYKFHCNKCNEDFICTGTILLRKFFLENDLCHPLVSATKEQFHINKIQAIIDKNKNLSYIKAKEIVELKDSIKTTIYKFHCNKCNEDFICTGKVIVAQCFLKNDMCHPLVSATKEQTYITKIQVIIDKNENLSYIELKEIIERKTNFKDSIYKFHCNKCNEDFECSGTILLNGAFLRRGLCHPISSKINKQSLLQPSFLDQINEMEEG